MTPALARIKRAVREAISRCGGVEGAGATAGRSKTIAGDWNNLAKGVFPSVECAIALDEVIVADGREAPIVSAMARELGGVFIMLPSSDSGDSDGLADKFIEISEEFGEIARDFRAARADGIVEPGEATLIRRDVGRMLATATAFDRLLERIERGETKG